MNLSPDLKYYPSYLDPGSVGFLDSSPVNLKSKKAYVERATEFLFPDHLIGDDVKVPLVHQTPDTASLPLQALVTILRVVSRLDVALHQVRELIVALLVRILGGVLKIVCNNIMKPPNQNVVYTDIKVLNVRSSGLGSPVVTWNTVISKSPFSFMIATYDTTGTTVCVVLFYC